MHARVASQPQTCALMAAPVATRVTRAPQAVLYFIRFLAHAASQGHREVLTLLAARRLEFVAALNVDSYAANLATKRPGMHRKSLLPKCAGTGESGVDLNRNYGVCWGRDREGSSPLQCAEVRAKPRAHAHAAHAMHCSSARAGLSR